MTLEQQWKFMWLPVLKLTFVLFVLFWIGTWIVGKLEKEGKGGDIR